MSRTPHTTHRDRLGAVDLEPLDVEGHPGPALGIGRDRDENTDAPIRGGSHPTRAGDRRTDRSTGIDDGGDALPAEMTIAAIENEDYLDSISNVRMNPFFTVRTPAPEP